MSLKEKIKKEYYIRRKYEEYIKDEIEPISYNEFKKEFLLKEERKLLTVELVKMIYDLLDKTIIQNKNLEEKIQNIRNTVNKTFYGGHSFMYYYSLKEVQEQNNKIYTFYCKDRFQKNFLIIKFKLDEYHNITYIDIMYLDYLENPGIMMSVPLIRTTVDKINEESSKITETIYKSVINRIEDTLSKNEIINIDEYYIQSNNIKKNK